MTDAPAPAADVRSVRLDDLVTVPDYQIRKRTDPGTVARYAGFLRAGAELPPVKVGMIDGALVLLDGFHRVEAHRKAGRWEIAAEIVATNAREAKWLAAEANMKHGLPLKRSELRGAFRAFVHAGRHLDARRRVLSLREMAQGCGVGSHNTVRSWLEKDFPRIYRQLRTEYPQGGGLRRAPGRTLAEIAEESIRAAVAAARGVPDEDERARLALALRQAAAEVENPSPLVLAPIEETTGDEATDY